MSGTEEFTPVAETAVEHQFDELDVDDAPAVGIVMGSKSDMAVMERAGGLDALLAITQMPPGVPVASVGVDNAKNAAVLAARILGA